MGFGIRHILASGLRSKNCAARDHIAGRISGFGILLALCRPMMM